MFQTEQLFRHKLVHTLRLAGFKANEIESPTAPGIPDIWFGGDTQGWIECKNSKTDAERYRKVPFQPGQLSWLQDAHAHGVLVFLAWSFPEGVYMFRGFRIREKYTEVDYNYAFFMSELDKDCLYGVLT